MIALNELAVAVIENKLAETLHGQEKYDEAEPRYRSALATFLRLRRDDYAGRSLMSLGSLLMMRPAQGSQDKELDYENAEDYLLDAVDIFRKAGSAGRPRQREALLLLQTLYSPQHWNDTESQSRIEAALRTLDESSPGGDSFPNLPKG